MADTQILPRCISNDSMSRHHDDPHLQPGRPRLAQGHTVREWVQSDLNPDHLLPFKQDRHPPSRIRRRAKLNCAVLPQFIQQLHECFHP